MMLKFSNTVRAEVDAVVEQFNGNHSDAICLVACFGGDPEDYEQARIVRLTPGHVDLEASRSSESTRLRLDFEQPAHDLAGTQQNLISLVSTARSRAGDRVPLTRLEKDLQRTANLLTYRSEVRSVREVGPGMREITVAGGLTEFVNPGLDAFVYVMVPHESASRLPDGFTMADWRAWQGEDKPDGAYYTIRRAREDELDLWFVLHGDDGPLSKWAANAQAGDDVALWGPRIAFELPEHTRSLLLIGDETAQPALAVIMETLAQQLEITALLEVQAPGHELPMPGLAPGAIRWCYRGDHPPGDSDCLRDEVQKLSLNPEGIYVFGAGETKRIASLRRYLHREVGISSKSMHLTGYWRKR